MARDVNHIVDAPADPVVSFVVSASPVPRKLIPPVRRQLHYSIRATHIITFVHIEISIHVALVCSPNSAGHAGPRFFNCQNTLHVIAMYFFPRDRVDDCRFDAKER